MAFDPCQLGLFAPAPAHAGGPVRLMMPGADVTYEAAFLEAREAAGLFSVLHDEVPWKQSRRKMYDRVVDVPRLQKGFFADELPACLRDVHARLEAELGTRFAWVLANLYRDGRDSVAPHADDEEDLGPRPVIASLSLGATRRFVFRPKPGCPGETLALDLPAGSLIVMAGATQLHWDHGVPKVARPVGPRINLTFRTRDGSR